MRCSYFVPTIFPLEFVCSASLFKIWLTKGATLAFALPFVQSLEEERMLFCKRRRREIKDKLQMKISFYLTFQNLNKDFHTSSNVSVWQRSVRAGGMCASPNSFIIARTFERYDYARLPSMQKLQKIKGKRGILTFHGASAVDGDALTKKIFSLVNEFEGQSLWDCVELCLRSKMYWNAVAKWSSHEMKKSSACNEEICSWRCVCVHICFTSKEFKSSTVASNKYKDIRQQ